MRSAHGAAVGRRGGWLLLFSAAGSGTPLCLIRLPTVVFSQFRQRDKSFALHRTIRTLHLSRRRRSMSTRTIAPKAAVGKQITQIKQVVPARAGAASAAAAAGR